MDIRVSLFDDSASIRESLGELLAYTKGITLTGVHADALQAHDAVLEEQPQIVLMDIDMPGVSGIEAVARIRAVSPATLVIMLTVFEDTERVYASLAAGAMGYLLKSTPPAALIAAIREAHEGGAPMTPGIARKVLQHLHAPAPPAQQHGLNPREQEVLQCLVDGLSYKMVADRLNISINTVRSHIKHIYEKLHVRSNTEAVALTLQRRLLGR